MKWLIVFGLVAGVILVISLVGSTLSDMERDEDL